MTTPTVLVTGATGLVGEAVVLKLLVDKFFPVIAAARGATRLLGLCPVVPFDLTQSLDLPCLSSVQVIVHCAARVHVMDDNALDPLAEFRKVNVDGTLRLAQRAAESGVTRFIFISSIKVNGESTQPGRPFTAEDQPNPSDAYGASKYEAEEKLTELSRQTGMEVVIIRPPLVYGPGVKANFLSMLSWLSKSVPLPLGAIRNQRSLVAVTNLVSLIVTCINHPAAANQTFLVSDGEDISTTDLLQRLAIALNQPVRLLRVPDKLLGWAAALLGKRSVADRICGTLQIDIDKNRELLGWTPSISMDNALIKTARYFKEQRSK